MRTRMVLALFESLFHKYPGAHIFDRPLLSSSAILSTMSRSRDDPRSEHVIRVHSHVTEGQCSKICARIRIINESVHTHPHSFGAPANTFTSVK